MLHQLPQGAMLWAPAEPLANGRSEKGNGTYPRQTGKQRRKDVKSEVVWIRTLGPRSDVVTG
ncbi:hypothetical protein Are01nite_08570 [Actinoplanes regularis]|nr:hypothetical protein Are01nite_08570 [Actinoplanes regularis]